MSPLALRSVSKGGFCVRSLAVLAKERSTGRAWSCRGRESVLCTASPLQLLFSPKLTSTSEVVWRAESSVQPWAWCLRRFCGRACRAQGTSQCGGTAAGCPSTRRASLLSSQAALNLSWPWEADGKHFSPFLLGMALLFSDELCPFPGVVLSFLPSLPFPPRGQGGSHRVAVSVVGPQRPCLQGGRAPSPAILTSQLPKDCCAGGVRLPSLEQAVWGTRCPNGPRHLPEKGPGA